MASDHRDGTALLLPELHRLVYEASDAAAGEELERLLAAIDSVDSPYPLDIFPERTDEQRAAIFAAMRSVDKYATEWFYAHVARDRGRVIREWLERAE